LEAAKAARDETARRTAAEATRLADALRRATAAAVAAAAAAADGSAADGIPPRAPSAATVAQNVARADAVVRAACRRERGGVRAVRAGADQFQDTEAMAEAAKAAREETARRTAAEAAMLADARRHTAAAAAATAPSAADTAAAIVAQSVARADEEDSEAMAAAARGGMEPPPGRPPVGRIPRIRRPPASAATLERPSLPPADVHAALRNPALQSAAAAGDTDALCFSDQKTSRRNSGRADRGSAKKDKNRRRDNWLACAIGWLQRIPGFSDIIFLIGNITGHGEPWTTVVAALASNPDLLVTIGNLVQGRMPGSGGLDFFEGVPRGEKTLNNLNRLFYVAPNDDPKTKFQTEMTACKEVAKPVKQRKRLETITFGFLMAAVALLRMPGTDEPSATLIAAHPTMLRTGTAGRAALQDGLLHLMALHHELNNGVTDRGIMTRARLWWQTISTPAPAAAVPLLPLPPTLPQFSKHGWTNGKVEMLLQSKSMIGLRRFNKSHYEPGQNLNERTASGQPGIPCLRAYLSDQYQPPQPEQQPAAPAAGATAGANSSAAAAVLTAPAAGTAAATAGAGVAATAAATTTGRRARGASTDSNGRAAQRQRRRSPTPSYTSSADRRRSPTRSSSADRGEPLAMERSGGDGNAARGRGRSRSMSRASGRSHGHSRSSSRSHSRSRSRSRSRGASRSRSRSPRHDSDADGGGPLRSPNRSSSPAAARDRSTSPAQGAATTSAADVEERVAQDPPYDGRANFPGFGIDGIGHLTSEMAALAIKASLRMAGKEGAPKPMAPLNESTRVSIRRTGGGGFAVTFVPARPDIAAVQSLLSSEVWRSRLETRIADKVEDLDGHRPHGVRVSRGPDREALDSALRSGVHVTAARDTTAANARAGMKLEQRARCAGLRGLTPDEAVASVLEYNAACAARNAESVARPPRPRSRSRSRSRPRSRSSKRSRDPPHRRPSGRGQHDRGSGSASEARSHASTSSRTESSRSGRDRTRSPGSDRRRSSSRASEASSRSSASSRRSSHHHSREPARRPDGGRGRSTSRASETSSRPSAGSRRSSSHRSRERTRSPGSERGRSSGSAPSASSRPEASSRPSDRHRARERSRSRSRSRGANSSRAGERSRARSRSRLNSAERHKRTRGSSRAPQGDDRPAPGRGDRRGARTSQREESAPQHTRDDRSRDRRSRQGSGNSSSRHRSRSPL
jgi:hypothetical protein